MIPEPVVDEVRARADIVAVVGEQVPLKRAGKEFKALCPFHQEKTASFYVVPAKGFFKCFGCGESGDVFDFLMKRQGLDFPEAVRTLAVRYGVEIPESVARPDEEPNRALYEAVAFAADWYRRRLVESDDGDVARAYLRRRGLDDAAAERFGLGYAPDAWRALLEAAEVHGIERAVLLEAGLIKESERSDEPYDRLRNRLVFPIHEIGGRVVGFGGRILGESGPGAPKYLNSPETPIYHKGSLLYGLNWARHAIRREEAVLVVEGYMDYLSLAARGVEHVVAPLGTALTDEQAALLARYTKKALLLYDSDDAGLRASFRSGDALLRAGVHPLAVTMPEGEDPDSLIRKEDGRGMKRALEAAVDIIERKLQILEQHDYLADIRGTRRALDRLLPTVRAARDPALRDMYVGRIASATGVRRETLEEELAVAARTDARSSLSARIGPARTVDRRRPGAGDRRASDPPGVASQRKLLLLLIRDAAWISRAAGRLEPEDFTDAVAREIYGGLQGVVGAEAQADAGGAEPWVAERGGAVPGTVLDRVSAVVSPAAGERLAALRGSTEELTDTDRMFEDLVNKIRAERLHRRLDELESMFAVAEGRSDHEAATALLRERLELARELQRVRQGYERRVRKQARPRRGERSAGT
ncbi:MAG: DNA primase [Longimicrobiales bacterium]